MAYEFKFPDVGEGIHEGEIVKWRVKVGDEVKENQPLVEMETAKAIVELPSPKAGTVLAAFGREGEIVRVGKTLVVIGKKGEKFEAQSATVAAGAQKSPDAKPAENVQGVIGQIPTESGLVLPPRRAEVDMKSGAQKSAGGANLPATPPHGTMTGENFEGPVERVPLKGVRKIIAQHMAKSYSTIPHVTHMEEADASALVSVRAAKKTEAEKLGVKLTFMPFLIKAAVEVLKKHPELNAAFAGQEIIYKKYYNIGIAVDTQDGLMVPVIKNADKKDIFALAREIVELADKCKNRKILPAELQGGTFTITNIGSIGGIYATPIIIYGQTANLGVMRIKEKPVAINGKVEVRPILTLALSYDHRVVDGAAAARFTNDLCAALENLN